MIRRRILTVGLLAGALGTASVSSVVAAAPAGIALIVSNSIYTSLAPLPACALSARAISTGFAERGYDVVRLADGTGGQLDGAIGQLSDQLRSTPDTPVVVYFCGYVAGQNGRAFLVPATASLERPSDILSQGVLAKIVVDIVANSGPRAALVLLEAVEVPNAPEAVDLSVLNRPGLPPGLGLLAASVTAGDPSQRLAASLVPRLKAGSVQVSDLINGVKQDPDGLVAALVALVRVPTDAAYLIGFPPPPPVKPLLPEPAPSEATIECTADAGPDPLTAPEPVVPAAVAELVPALPPGTATTPPEVSFPDENQMTDAMRREMQTKLADLGYYAGKIDGLFRGNTRAAIRRFQHELQAPMTGRLTGAQAERLMAVR